MTVPKTSNTKAQEKMLLKVFEDGDPLENVLLNLPLKDLLFAQTVCKAWKGAIDKSVLLQKALFFQPATDQMAFWSERVTLDENFEWLRDFVALANFTEDGGFFYCTPSQGKSFELVRKFTLGRNKFIEHFIASEGNWFKRASAVGRGRRNDENRDELRKTASRTSVFLNPLLLEEFPWFRSFFYDLAQAPDRFPKISLIKDSDLEPKARYLKASWRRMLICQPPLAAARACVGGNTAWNAMGAEATMKELRERMGAASGKTVTIYGANRFKIWEDGQNLKEVMMSRITLQDEVEDNNAASDTNADFDSNGVENDKESDRSKKADLMDRLGKRKIVYSDSDEADGNLAMLKKRQSEHWRWKQIRGQGLR